MVRTACNNGNVKAVLVRIADGALTFDANVNVVFVLRMYASSTAAMTCFFLICGYLPQKYLTACFVKRFLSASSKYGIIKSKSASAETFAFKSSG